MVLFVIICSDGGNIPRVKKYEQDNTKESMEPKKH
jgi:hypothetical protein